MEVVGFRVEVPFEMVVRLVPELAKKLEELRDESEYSGIHNRPIKTVAFEKVELTNVDPETWEDCGKEFEWMVTVGFVGLESKVVWRVRNHQLEDMVGSFLMLSKWQLAEWLHKESFKLIEEAIRKWEESTRGE